MHPPCEQRHPIADVLAQARAQLDRVEPDNLNCEHADGALIVDIRPVEQRTRDGALPGAIVIDRNVLEWRLDPTCEHHHADIAGYDTRIVIVCNEGYQSSLAAALLQTIGLHRATDLIGGFQAWQSGQRPDAETGRSPTSIATRDGQPSRSRMSEM